MITASAPALLVDMKVADIGLSLTVNKGRTARANAAVTVRDASGRAVAGATVAGRWSGLVSGSASIASGSNGVATFQSPNSQASSGSSSFTVTGVTLDGYQYQPAQNVDTSDAISR